MRTFYIRAGRVRVRIRSRGFARWVESPGDLGKKAARRTTWRQQLQGFIRS